MNLVKLPWPSMMSSPLKPFMMSPPATPPTMHVIAAVERRLTGRRAGVAEHQLALAAAALDPVVTVAADDLVEAFVADDDVVAEAAR